MKYYWTAVVYQVLWNYYCTAVLFCTVVLLNRTVLMYCTAVLSCTRYCATVCTTTSKYTVLYRTSVPCGTVLLYCLILYRTVLYCTVLYCTVLFYGTSPPCLRACPQLPRMYDTYYRWIEAANATVLPRGTYIASKLGLDHEEKESTGIRCNEPQQDILPSGTRWRTAAATHDVRRTAAYNSIVLLQSIIRSRYSRQSTHVKVHTRWPTKIVFRAVAKTRCTLLEYGQSKVKGRNESQTSTTEAE